MVNENEIKRKKAQENVLLFLEKENIYYQLEGALSYLIGTEIKNYHLILKAEKGESFTDGKNIVVDIPEMFYSWDPIGLFAICRALNGHEAQHVVSSDIKKYNEFIEAQSEKLAQKYALPVASWEKIVAAVANALEDGRIERILSNNYKGYIKYLQYLNGSTWLNQPVQGKKELEEFLYSIAMLAVLGVVPKQYAKYYEGKPLAKAIDQIRNLIQEGIRAVTCTDCLAVCENILNLSGDYLAALIPQKSSQRSIKKMKDHCDFSGTCEEKELNTKSNETAHLQPEPSNQEKASGDQKQDSTDRQADNSKEPSDRTEGNQEKAKSDSSDSSKQSDSSDAKNSQKVSQNQETEKNNLSEDEIQKQIEKTVAQSYVASKQAMAEIERNNTALKKNRDKKRELNQTEIHNICIQYSGQKSSCFVEIKDYYSKYEAPPHEWIAAGKRFRRQVENILINERANNLRGQRKGILNTGDLWKLGLKDPRIFVQKGSPMTSNYVAYLLKDGSGSMCNGTKDEDASFATAVIEYGLKSLIPLKITQFNTKGNFVVHHRIKNFNDNEERLNYTYSSYNDYQATGGNKDGFSIRVATQELLKRPEKDRILVILSDGLPQDYPSNQIALDDVKAAVKEARAAKINLFAIFFESKLNRDMLFEEYRYMYERNIISCEPKDISVQLTKLFLHVLSR